MTPRAQTMSLIEMIASERGFTLEEMLSPSRRHPICRARWVAWHQLYLKGLSSPQIGEIFRRHHTTILYGLSRMREIV